MSLGWTRDQTKPNQNKQTFLRLTISSDAFEPFQDWGKPFRQNDKHCAALMLCRVVRQSS
jgi:hypothetical protein